jgi:hypothetical protein
VSNVVSEVRWLIYASWPRQGREDLSKKRR